MPRLGSRVRVSFPAPNPKDLVCDGVFYFKDLSPHNRRKYKVLSIKRPNDVSSDTSDHNGTWIFDSLSDCKPVSNAGLPLLGDRRPVLLAIVSLRVYGPSMPCILVYTLVFLNKRVCCVICLRDW